MSNKIEDLRKHLFDAIEAVKSGMPVDKARAIAELAQVVINSAKVEVEFMKATRARKGTGFIEEKEVPGTPAQPRLVKGSAMSGSR